jgi:phage tail-like protein
MMASIISVTNVKGVPHLLGARIDLSWQNPPPTAFATGVSQQGIRILRQERTFPLAPGSANCADDEDCIYDGPIITHFIDDGSQRKLNPLTTYYYTFFVKDNASPPHYFASDAARIAVFATKYYSLAEKLYAMLPAVHQSYDTLSPRQQRSMGGNQQVLQALEALPSSLQDKGQLWRFFLATVSSIDLMRSFAEGLPQLIDINLARPEFLPLLAQWIGWELDRTRPISFQRNEIKFAPRLYRSVGTLPHLRTMVMRYTGWFTQIVEFSEHILRSNGPPQLNIFALLQTPEGWRGADDASTAFQFIAANDGVTTTLTSGVSEPFALRPGMELALTVDNRTPITARFLPGDFADLSHAGADEVVRALNHTLYEVTAVNQLGKIVITSNTRGANAALQVTPAMTSLVALEGAPRGRLTVCRSQTVQADRALLFYETADPALPAEQFAAAQAFSTVSAMGTDQRPMSAPPPPVNTYVPSLPLGRLRYKVFRAMTWSDSRSVFRGMDTAQGEPTAVVRTDGSLWLAWVENPSTDNARIRFMLGTIAAQSDIIDWSQRPQDVPAAVKGRYADLHAVSDKAGTGVHLFWAEHDDLHWFIRTTHWDGTNWQPASSVADGLNNDGVGANREPYAVQDSAGRIWLFWSHRQGDDATNDNWTLHRRVFDGTAWGSEAALTAPPDKARAADREPCAILLPNTDPQQVTLRVFFRSDRAGGPALWFVTITPADPTTGTVSAPAPLITDPAIGQAPADYTPAPVRMPGDALWLFYRSDRSIALSRLATRALPQLENRVTLPSTLVRTFSPDPSRSFRIQDSGTTRRFSGSTSVMATNAARIRQIGQVDDLLAYTPVGLDGRKLSNDDLYTPGSIGLYASQLLSENPFSQNLLELLGPLLQSFLPINVRAIVKQTS